MRVLDQALARVRDTQRRLALVYGMNRRNVELVYPNNPRTLYPLADDKLLAKEILSAAGVPVPPNIATCTGLHELPQVIDIILDTDELVIKPSRGSGGDGILVLGQRIGPGRWTRAGGEIIDIDAIHVHLANILFGAYARGALEDRVMIEPRIVPHSFYESLWQDGLSDVRIITLRGRPLMSMVRVPTRRSAGRANLHQGGLGLAVDLQSGRVGRAVCKGKSLTHHPDTGAPMVGLQLPAWQEMLDVAVQAAGAVPLGYLGVDIVMDRERGPQVLEINARPGLEIQNVNGMALGRVLEGLE